MDQIVVHGSYLINGGSCDMEILNRARACMLDECKRCEQLGIIYYNIHPGKYLFMFKFYFHFYYVAGSIGNPT